MHASLTNKGKRFPTDLITVKRIMGEGSYGQVFEGGLAGKEGPERVVLKRVKQRVQGAEEMGQMEHLLNVYASKAAKGSIADFVGYVEVSEDEATTKLTQGVWLMWRYQGHRTLANYLKRRDCITALSEDLGVDKSAAVATVMKQLFESIAALHNAGLVHRDVKPMNIIFAEDEKSFKLIDLGACADLRSGTNYIPDESILDPTYCPPEQYCMPTDAPNLSKHGAFAMAMSPLLWQRFKPDRFDSYSAGLVLMQLALPKLRTGTGLKSFNSSLKSVAFDVKAWRRRANLSSKDTAILDADDSAGWDLAEALLRPRMIDVDEESGAVKFVNTNHEAVRLGVSLALTHNFMNQAQQPTGSPSPTRALQRLPSFGRSFGRSLSRGSGSSSSGSTMERAAAAAAAINSQPAASTSSQGGMFGMALGVWRKATSKLFDLEAKIAHQTSAVQTQTTRVQKLRAQAATGKVSVARLEQEQGVLTKMTARLAGLTTEFNSTAQSANRLLGSLMNRAKGTTSSAISPEAPQAQPQLAPDSLQKPSRRSDVPPSLQKRSNLPASLQKAQKQQEELTAAAATAADSSRDQARASRAGRGLPQSSRVEAEQARPAKRKLSRRTPEKQEEPPATTQGKAVGAGVNMLYAGLKFTGLALNVAGDLAKGVRQDAERMMKEVEADAAAKKLSKESAAAFVDLLRQAEPGITSQTSFEDIQIQCGQDPRWQALTQDKRQQVFETYQTAVIKIEAAEHQRAVADFKVMLSQSDLTADSQWSTVQSQLSNLAPFSAVKSHEDRQQLLQDYMSDLQVAADSAAAVAKSEDDFQGLLQSLDPPLTPRSSWPALRRRIGQDPRYTALPERRCRQLFNTYHSTLKDLQSAPSRASSSRSFIAWPSSSAATASSSSSVQSSLTEEEAGEVASALGQLSEQFAGSALPQPSTSGRQQQVWDQAGPGQGLAELTQPDGAQVPAAGDISNEGQQSAAQLGALEALRQEQARLKAEYDRMEAKLQEMEARLQLKEAGQADSSTSSSSSAKRSASVAGNGAHRTK